jgi:hypothetical protein
MRTSQDAVTLHVSRQSVSDVLGADIAANEGPDGRPFIVIEPVDRALSPVPGVVFVQAARTRGGRWIIEHRSGDRIMALEYPVLSVEFLIDVLALFINGDGEEFLDLEWEETDVTGCARRHRPFHCTTGGPAGDLPLLPRRGLRRRPR